MHIGIPYDRLKCFREEDDPLEALFDYCFRGNKAETNFKFFSWSCIVAALKSRDVGEIDLAEAIAKKYCQQELLLNKQFPMYNKSKF